MGPFQQPRTTKMKAIIFADGSDGDIHPHLGLGCELRSRGHHVVFITTLNYVGIAREFGFEALSLIERSEQQVLDQAESVGTMAKIKANFKFYCGKISAICELAASHLDDRSILVAPPFAYPIAKLLHSKYGVPYVSTALSPANIYSLKNPASFKGLEWLPLLPYSMRKLLFQSGERLFIDPFVRILVKEAAQKMNLPLPRRVFSQWARSPQRIIGLFPAWFCPIPEDWPDQLLLTGFPLFQPKAGEQQLSGGLSQFLDAGPPPIVFNPGTETKNARAFFTAALKVIETQGMRGVFLTRLTNQLPKLPDTVWHESYTSLRLLLPRARILVHHGGIGTIALALNAGIPQLVLPLAHDNFDNGRRVERLGCGLVQQNPLDGIALLEKLQHLLTSPQVRDACRLAQTRIEPGTRARSRAVGVIEETFRSARQIAISA